MSRLGQFQPDQHTLVCGIDEKVALSCQGDFIMTLGGNPEQYKISADKLRKVTHHVWKNSRGKRVWIVPISEFHKNTICCVSFETFQIHIRDCPSLEKKVEQLQLF